MYKVGWKGLSKVDGDWRPSTIWSLKRSGQVDEVTIDGMIGKFSGNPFKLTHPRNEAAGEKREKKGTNGSASAPPPRARSRKQKARNANASQAHVVNRNGGKQGPRTRTSSSRSQHLWNNSSDRKRVPAKGARVNSVRSTPKRKSRQDRQRLQEEKANEDQGDDKEKQYEDDSEVTSEGSPYEDYGEVISEGIPSPKREIRRDVMEANKAEAAAIPNGETWITVPAERKQDPELEQLHDEKQEVDGKQDNAAMNACGLLSSSEDVLSEGASDDSPRGLKRILSGKITEPESPLDSARTGNPKTTQKKRKKNSNLVDDETIYSNHDIRSKAQKLTRERKKYIENLIVENKRMHRQNGVLSERAKKLAAENEKLAAENKKLAAENKKLHRQNGKNAGDVEHMNKIMDICSKLMSKKYTLPALMKSRERDSS